MRQLLRPRDGELRVITRALGILLFGRDQDPVRGPKARSARVQIVLLDRLGLGDDHAFGG